jgi:hypothetical protein
MKTLVIGQAKTGKTEYCVNKIQDYGKVLYFSDDYFSVAQLIDIEDNDNLIFKTELNLDLTGTDDVDLIIVDYNIHFNQLNSLNIEQVKCSFIITYLDIIEDIPEIIMKEIAGIDIGLINSNFDRLVKCLSKDKRIILDKYEGVIEE